MATESSSFWLEILKKGGDFFSNVSEEILGEKVKAQLEDKLQPVLKLLSSPEGRRAFDKAFTEATAQFKRGATTSDERQFRDEIVNLLTHTTKKGVGEASREVIQSYVLASEPDRTQLDRWVQRQLSFTNFSVGKRTYTPDEVSEALDEFFIELGRAFWEQEPFREKAIQAETTQLLRQILEELRQQAPDLATMRRDYLDYLGRRFAYLDLGGIAPKVNNRTVKLMMSDIYVPIEAERELNLRQIWQQARRHGKETGLPDISAVSKLLDGKILVDELEKITQGLTHQDELESWQAFRNRFAHQATTERVDIQGVLKEPRIVLLGHPGTGKSTTLRYISFALATGLTEKLSEDMVNRLPILVRLVKYAKTQKQNPALKLRDYIQDVHNPKWGQLFRDALEKGECLVMLDGLDEIIDPYQRAEITDEVEALVADYEDNHYLVSSRIIGYETSWLTGDFTHFTIGALPEKSIQTFLQKWYEAIEREGGVDEDEEARAKAKALTEAIQNRPGMKRLAENPLLLTIIALVNQKERRLPNRRIEVYRYAAETLVESWPRIHRSVVFDSEEVLSLLAPVAYRIFSQQSSEEIAEEELLEMLVEIVPRLKPGLSKNEATNYLRDLLPQLSEHSGLFLERGFDSEKNQRLYGFLHLTFAEYLAARYLASQWEAEKNDRERQALLAKYAPVPRWREVFLLMVAYVGLDGRRNAANQILADILRMNLPHEEQLHRCILLAGRCLADDLRVESEAAAWVYRQLTDVLLQTSITPLRNQISEINQVAQGSLYRDEISTLLLDKLSQEESVEVCASIASALGQIGGEVAVEPLMEQLSQEKNAEVRGTIASALGRIGSEAVVEPLIEQLSQEKNAEVRGSIAGALGRIGSEVAVEALVEQLSQEESADVRDSIASALGQIGSEAAVEALVEQLSQEESVLVRDLIVMMLAYIGSEAAVEALVKQLSQEESAQVRASIASALGQIGSEVAVEALVEQLSQEENFGVRGSIASALGRIESEAAVVDGLVGQLSQEENAEMRANIANVLGQIGGEVAVAALVRKLSQEENFGMRDSIANALGQIGGEVAVETLVGQLRQEESPRVRARIASALGQIGSEKGIRGLILMLEDTGYSFFEEFTFRKICDWAFETILEIEAKYQIDPGKEILTPNQPVKGPWNQ